MGSGTLASAALMDPVAEATLLLSPGIELYFICHCQLTGQEIQWVKIPGATAKGLA
jgi:hypothetical protein